jgi:hypothetical protein
MKTRIDFGYAYFNFNYLWLRDKQIVLKGDENMGMLIIVDEKGRAVAMYGYELIG